MPTRAVIVEPNAIKRLTTIMINNFCICSKRLQDDSKLTIFELSHIHMFHREVQHSRLASLFIDRTEG